MSKLIKVAHLTSAHTRNDSRIFLKMCSSLAKEYDVSFVVADGKGDDIQNNVKIYDTGIKARGRISRMTKTTNNVFKKAMELDCDIYHLHDPELMPIGIKLKNYGKKVIFDSHEDVGQDILTKEYIPLFLRKLVSFIYSFYEVYACKKFDYIVAATPFIRDKFLKINLNTIDINNYPILGELENNIPWNEKKDEICYIGVLSKIRGAVEIVESMQYCNATLNIVGNFENKELEDNINKISIKEKTKIHGFLNRSQVSEVMKYQKAGLVTFYPVPNHTESQPNKMFEYMSAGIPVIASNFKLWKDIIETNYCGICVDPMNPKDIASAINFIISHPTEAEKMAKNGKKSILEKYNWKIEEQKIFEVYKRLCE